MHCGRWSSSCWWCWKRHDQVISHGQWLVTHNHTWWCPVYYPCFFCHGKKHYQLSLYRAYYPFQWDIYNQQKWLWLHQKSVQSCNQGQQNRFIRLFFVCDAKEGQVQVYVNLGKNPFIPGIFIDATQGLRAMKFVSTHFIKHYHLILQVDHWWSLYISTQFIHFKRHFGIPHSFFEFEPATLITPRNADLALQVSNIQQTRFQLDRKGLLLLASNSALNLHFFMALPGRVIPIMIHDMSLTVAILVCKSDFNKDNKACSQTFSVHDFCFSPPFSHSSLKVLPRGASYMPGNVELKRVELHRRLMNSQDDWTWKIHPNWVGTGRFMKFLISWIWRNCC